jgi:hypothetical protein
MARMYPVCVVTRRGLFSRQQLHWSRELVTAAFLYLRAVEVPFEFVEHDAEAEADPVRDHVDEEGGSDDDPTVAAVLGGVAVACPCKMSQFKGRDAAYIALACPCKMSQFKGRDAAYIALACPCKMSQFKGQDAA